MDPGRGKLAVTSLSMRAWSLRILQMASFTFFPAHLAKSVPAASWESKRISSPWRRYQGRVEPGPRPGPPRFQHPAGLPLAPQGEVYQEALGLRAYLGETRAAIDVVFASTLS